MLPVDPGKKKSGKETSIHYSHTSRYKGEEGTKSVQNTASEKWEMGNGEAIQKGETGMGLYGLLGGGMG